ncbi:unnamed protein product [Owenia fusiformis]|uniref:Uncharacterized protein n=1 Tax=Owenia fusiformis TaxID=6347 RepID=A0A8J1TY17_OWEFU|nr:unnamed protein product [Owenia fusiformis]
MAPPSDCAAKGTEQVNRPSSATVDLYRNELHGGHSPKRKVGLQIGNDNQAFISDETKDNKAVFKKTQPVVPFRKDSPSASMRENHRDETSDISNGQRIDPTSNKEGMPASRETNIHGLERDRSSPISQDDTIPPRYETINETNTEPNHVKQESIELTPVPEHEVIKEYVASDPSGIKPIHYRQRSSDKGQQQTKDLQQETKLRLDVSRRGSSSGLDSPDVDFSETNPSILNQLTFPNGSLRSNHKGSIRSPVRRKNRDGSDRSSVGGSAKNISGKTRERKSSIKFDDATSLYEDHFLSKLRRLSYGTNFKNDITSLYSCFRPLFATMKCLGIFHTVEFKGEKKLITPSTVYSVIIMIILWLNFFRFFAVYEYTDVFGTELFFKIVCHVWFFQSAVGATASFRVSRGLPEFLGAWHTYMENRSDLGYKTYLERWSFIYVIIACFLAIINLVIIGLWIFTESMHSQILYEPFITQRNNIDGYNVPLAAKIIFMVVQFFSSMAWAFPISLCVMFSLGLRQEFIHFSKKFSLATTASRVFEGNMESFRHEHFKICKITDKADALFNAYILIVYITNIPLVCFLLYTLIYEQFDRSITIAMALYWLFSSVLYLYMVTGAAAMLNASGCSPAADIHDMNLTDDRMSTGKMIQISVFLSKATSGKIGFTAWRLFYVDRSTLVSVAASILAYIIILLKLGSGLAPRPALPCFCPEFKNVSDAIEIFQEILDSRLNETAFALYILSQILNATNSIPTPGYVTSLSRALSTSVLPALQTDVFINHTLTEEILNNSTTVSPLLFNMTFPTQVLGNTTVVPVY